MGVDHAPRFHVHSLVRFLIVDGTNIALFASFGAKIDPARSTKSAVAAIEHAAEVTEATHLLVALDSSGPTFRRALAADYKAGRTTETGPYVSALRSACHALGWATETKETFEADDVIATRTMQAAAVGISVSIYTGDSDALALIAPWVDVYRPLKVRETKRWGEAEVLARYGVRPAQLAEYKALMGESGDHIAGVPGIGPGKAARLLQTYGSLEAMLAATPAKSDRELAMVQAAADIARRTLSLTTLRCDVPLPALDLACHVYAPGCRLATSGAAQEELQW